MTMPAERLAGRTNRTEIDLYVFCSSYSNEKEEVDCDESK